MDTMKAFFIAIRNNETALVLEQIKKDKSVVNCVAKQPPKKDDGQSPLQVAFKIGNLKIAKLLIENGAYINFIDKSDINEWNAPVLHDFIRGFIASVSKTEECFNEYFLFFEYLIEKKINFYLKDSYGNTSLTRLLLDTDLLYQYQHKLNNFNQLSSENRNIVTENRLEKIFNTFINHYPEETILTFDVKQESRNTGIYDQYKIDTFSIELLNKLSLKKYKKEFKNF